MASKQDLVSEIKDVAINQVLKLGTLNQREFNEVLTAWCTGTILLTQNFDKPKLKEHLSDLERYASEMLDDIDSEKAYGSIDSIQNTLLCCIKTLADLYRTERDTTRKTKQVTLMYDPQKRVVVIDASEEDFVPEFLKYALEAHGIPKDATIKFIKQR